MAKEKYPTIIEDGISREMTKEEFNTYRLVSDESKSVVNTKVNEIKSREEAIAKLVALGLTEENLKAMGL